MRRILAPGGPAGNSQFVQDGAPSSENVRRTPCSYIRGRSPLGLQRCGASKVLNDGRIRECRPARTHRSGWAPVLRRCTSVTGGPKRRADVRRRQKRTILRPDRAETAQGCPGELYKDWRRCVSSLAGDELLSAVDIIGRAGEGRVDHDVHGKCGDVGRFDDAPDGKRRTQLLASGIEAIAEKRRRQRGIDETGGDQIDSDRRELEREAGGQRRHRGGDRRYEPEAET